MGGGSKLNKPLCKAHFETFLKSSSIKWNSLHWPPTLPDPLGQVEEVEIVIEPVEVSSVVARFFLSLELRCQVH